LRHRTAAFGKNFANESEFPERVIGALVVGMCRFAASTRKEEVMTKTLTTLAAVAALIAGISIASAQSTMSPKSPATSGSGSMSGTVQATGSGKFCIKGASGALDCKFASLSACNNAAKSGETCTTNPSSTTGSGSSGSKY
jgi:hypothetical protein